MGVKLKALRLDTDKESNGIWREFVPGLEFKVARSGNAAYRAEAAKVLAPYAGRGSSGPRDIEMQPVLAPVMAKHILKGWRGLEDESGAEIVYSPEKAKEILEDPAHIDLFEQVLIWAADNEAYREVQGN